MNHIDLRWKTNKRAVRYYIESLHLGDCYDTPNPSDKDTWVLVAQDVPEELAKRWANGDDSAIKGFEA